MPSFLNPNSPLARFFSLFATFTLATLPFPALALQPLEAFVRSAEVHSVDVQQNAAARKSYDAAHQIDIGRALPAISLRGTYTRNQYQVELPLSLLEGSSAPPGATLTLTPYDQFDFY